MWVDHDGRAHSEWLPDTAAVFDEQSLRVLRSASLRELEAVVEGLGDEDLRVLSRVETSAEFPAADEEDYIAVSLPGSLKITGLQPGGPLAAQIIARIELLPLRWQLDIVSAAHSTVWDILDSARQRTRADEDR